MVRTSPETKAASRHIVSPGKNVCRTADVHGCGQLIQRFFTHSKWNCSPANIFVPINCPHQLSPFNCPHQLSPSIVPIQLSPSIVPIQLFLCYFCLLSKCGLVWGHCLGKFKCILCFFRIFWDTTCTNL